MLKTRRRTVMVKQSDQNDTLLNVQCATFNLNRFWCRKQTKPTCHERWEVERCRLQDRDTINSDIQWDPVCHRSEFKELRNIKYAGTQNYGYDVIPENIIKCCSTNSRPNLIFIFSKKTNEIISKFRPKQLRSKFRNIFINLTDMKIKQYAFDISWPLRNLT